MSRTLVNVSCALASFDEIWPCDVSVLDAVLANRLRLHGPRQVTHTYLLALARLHGGRPSGSTRGKLQDGEGRRASLCRSGASVEGGGAVIGPY
jgi:hypothetical protein